ncbi:MAG: 4-hydroxythreonine-4-phosphate dehydrogenase PdxA [Alphaproteobacteria bacterium]
MAGASTPTGPLAVTMGEPAGIGGELCLKAWIARDRDVPPFCVLDDPDRLRALARTIAVEVPVEVVDDVSDAGATWPRALPVRPIPLSRPVTPGRPDGDNANAVMLAIEQAVDLAMSGKVAAVVTLPIQKNVLYGAGFRHPGLTEYVASLSGDQAKPVMMLACPQLRVVPVTVHQPLQRAVSTLSREAIVHCGRVAAEALSRDFGIGAPRLSVAALNPHAGENGSLGREEIEIILPAVEELLQLGIDAKGPLPADSLFIDTARRRYDAALCMYHDQALIPLKTIDFRHGVNVTLGLTIVRTSPDHGTALGIAGRGIADPTSLMEALRMARAVAARRASVRDGAV